VNERKDIYKVILFFLFSKLRISEVIFFLFSKLRISEVIFFLFSKIRISEVILFSKLCTDYHLYESQHCLFIAYRTTKLFFTGAVELPAPHLLSPPFSLHASTQATRLHKSRSHRYEKEREYGAMQAAWVSMMFTGVDVNVVGGSTGATRYVFTECGTRRGLCWRQP
jgi:hypothetical protein